MALTEVDIAEMALDRLGISKPLSGDADGTLANCTDSSLEKSVIDRWYARCRNATLEAYPWTFARKYATLTLADNGDGEAWEDEWDNAYVYPSDCLRVRRFVNDVNSGYVGPGYLGPYARSWEGSWAHDWAWRFVIRIHDGAKAILCNVDSTDAKIEYTFEATDASLYTEQFASVLAWRLAHEAAAALDVNPTRSQRALEMFVYESARAAAAMSNEENSPRNDDGDFLRARG